jgi:two-component system alkaline phosphatase synthesis response regulator PhoP
MTAVDSGTILIIEDDASFRRTYQDMFNTAGYTVIIAENGEIGWDLAKSEKPDLIMLDLFLPGLHGFEVLKYIRGDAETKNIPVVITTSMGADQDIRKGLELGATDYMVKGFFTPREILVKLRSVLANARAGKSPDSYKVSVTEAKADARQLQIYMKLTKLFTCPQCQEDILLDMTPDNAKTDGHWFSAHFVCPKCKKSF